MSDSLKATVIDIVLVSTISANGVLEELPPGLPPELPADDEPEPPRPPVAPVPPPALPLDAEPPLALEPPLDAVFVAAPPLAPADTVSPGDRLASETIMPLAGA